MATRRAGRPATRTARATRTVRPTLVKVVRTGGEVKEYAVEEANPTVADVLAVADLDLTKGDRVRVNGRTADEETAVHSGDIVSLAGKVAGGFTR